MVPAYGFLNELDCLILITHNQLKEKEAQTNHQYCFSPVSSRAIYNGYTVFVIDSYESRECEKKNIYVYGS